MGVYRAGPRGWGLGAVEAGDAVVGGATVALVAGGVACV